MTGSRAGTSWSGGSVWAKGIPRLILPDPKPSLFFASVSLDRVFLGF